MNIAIAIFLDVYHPAVRNELVGGGSEMVLRRASLLFRKACSESEGAR